MFSFFSVINQCQPTKLLTPNSLADEPKIIINHQFIDHLDK